LRGGEEKKCNTGSPKIWKKGVPKRKKGSGTKRNAVVRKGRPRFTGTCSVPWKKSIMKEEEG